MYTVPLRFVLSALACAIVAQGCGDSGAIPPGPKAVASPRRIVCANTAATEFVCCLVPSERVVGVPVQADDYSTIDLKTGGFERIVRIDRYTAEAVLVLKPDLVVTHEWQSADTTSVLRSQGIDVLVMKSATSYEDIRATLVDLGLRLDAVAKSADVVRGLDARVETVKKGSLGRASLTAMVYSNSGTGGSTAGPHTTADTMIRLTGMRNAVAEVGLDGHVSLDFERLLAIDPDFLIVAAQARGEGGSATKSVVESTAALANLKARKHGHIVILPAELMSADSPPLVDAAELLAREVDRALASAKQD